LEVTILWNNMCNVCSQYLREKNLCSYHGGEFSLLSSL
jgi:hypothetical protein